MKAIKTKKEMLKFLETAPFENDEQRNALVCALVGHSRICDGFFGYRYCGRCGETLGDSLAGVDFGIKDAVMIGHNCETCRKNYKECTWKDRLFVQNPFTEEKD